MKPTILFCIILAALILTITGNGSQLYAQIPADTDWSAASLWTTQPSCADAVFQVNLMTGTTWDDKVENAIAQAKSWVDSHPTDQAIVYFPAGTYNFTEEISLDYSCKNIIFQGAGSNLTTLKFYFGGTNQMCFKIIGSDPESNKRELANDLNKDSTNIQCTSSIGYTTPCWIRLCKEGHPYHDSWAQYSIGQITRLQSANGVSGTLKDAASKQYTTSRSTKIWPITPVMNIGIENLKIWRTDDGHAGTDGHNILFLSVPSCTWDGKT